MLIKRSICAISLEPGIVCVAHHNMCCRAEYLDKSYGVFGAQKKKKNIFTKWKLSLTTIGIENLYFQCVHEGEEEVKRARAHTSSSLAKHNLFHATH